LKPVPDEQETLSDTVAAHILWEKSQAAQGFPPYSLLVEALSQWRNEDWPAAERAIITQGLRGRTARRIRSASHNWWPALQGQVASGKLQVAGRRG